jgi:hypothetical protein
VKIHEYGPALLHAKTLVVDERLVSIGSANLDNRLFALNNELNVVLGRGHRGAAHQGLPPGSEVGAGGRQRQCAAWLERDLLPRAAPLRDQL